MMKRILLILFFVIFSTSVFAIGRQTFNDFRIGLIGGITNADQEGVNSLANVVNERDNSGISKLTKGIEGGLFMETRKGIFGLQLRPTYFIGSTDGGGNEYSIKAPIVNGILRAIALENQHFALFFQIGVNWTKAEMKIKEGDFTLEGSGSNVGYQAGAGFEIRFQGAGFFFEANYRGLEVDRLIAASSSGAPGAGGLSQYGNGQEIEFDNVDLPLMLSGTQLLAGFYLSF